jgi:hypothetical protein
VRRWTTQFQLSKNSYDAAAKRDKS